MLCVNDIFFHSGGRRRLPIVGDVFDAPVTESSDLHRVCKVDRMIAHMHLHQFEQPEGRTIGFKHTGDINALASGLCGQCFQALIDLECGRALGNNRYDVEACVFVWII